MYKLVVFVALIFATGSLSAPNPIRLLPALKHEHLQDEFGQYALRYVTAEGTIVSEKGKLITRPDGKGRVMVMEGEVTYVSDNGKKYVTKYTAGLDGVKVEGDHLPVAPTVPPVGSSDAPTVSTESSTDVSNTTVDAIPDAPDVPSMTTVAP